MAALRLSSASALPNPGPFFCRHQRLGPANSQKAGLVRKSGLKVRYTVSDSEGRSFDAKLSCHRSAPVLRDGEVDPGSDKPERLSIQKVRVPEAVEPPEDLIQTTPGLWLRGDELCNESNNSKKLFDLRTGGRSFHPKPVPFFKVVRPSELRGKKSAGRSSCVLPVELVRVLDLYEELNGNKGKVAWNLKADPTHNVTPSAGAASQTSGYQRQGLSRNSYGKSAVRGLPRSRGVGPRMVRVSGRSFCSAPMLMRVDPVYQPRTNLDEASTEVAHLKHAVVDSSLKALGQPDGLQRGLNGPGILAIRDRFRRWEQDRGFANHHCLPNEEEDLGQEGEVANMQTRPRVSNPLIDGVNNSAGDSFTALSLLGDDLHFEFDPAQTVLNCGDLVELSMSGPGYDSILGILTRQLGDQLQFYTMKGRWVHRPRKEVYFRVPNFVSEKLVEPVLPYLPSQQLPERLENRLQFFDSSVPREAGAPLIERMRAFNNSSELIYREAFTVLDNAHDLLCDKKDTLIMSLADIACRLLTLAGRSHEKPDELSPAELYAVHRTLTRSEAGFAIQLGGVDVARYFTIYSKAQVEMLVDVRQWVRTYQESLNAQHGDDHISTQLSKGNSASAEIVHGFVQKARRLIKASRERREPPRFGCIGPSTPSFSDHGGLLEPIPGEKFSGFEKDIIRFIEIWCSGELGYYSTLNSLPPVILRATGMYDGADLGSATGFAFLQEIGVYTPWERVSVYHKGLALPGHGVSPKADDHQTRVNNMRKSSSLELIDSMETLRRDWGDMDVYCIDDVQAKEIDDGISLERIPGSASEYWVHVHVANPSAFIAPDHWIAKMAQKTAETIYTPERTYPMLPSFVVDGKLSLGVNSPVLTFSAKLNKRGEIITYKIAPGLIRKVTHLTAGNVDRVLGVQRIEPKVIRVGRKTNAYHRPELSDSDVTASQKADFEIFKMLATARRQRRLSNGAVSVVMPGINCSVFGSVFSGPSRPPTRDQAQFWRGDPAIEMTSNWFDPTGRGYPAMDGDRIVEELMILASEVAAGWCHARNIPVPYVSSISTPSCKDPMEFHREVLLSSVSPGGYYPYDLGLEYLRLTAVTVSTTGGPLIRSGVERYARCTSPLRRYSDMLLHWQVEAALRYEFQHGQSSLEGNLRSDYLPFSRAQVDELLPWLQWRRRLMTMTSRNAQRFWAAQLLMRAVFYSEAELPRTFEMRVVKTVGYRRGVDVFGILMNLNVQVFAIVPDWMEKRGVAIGERYEVEITDIDVFHTVVRVSPLRLIDDD